MIFWVDEEISSRFAGWLTQQFQVEAYSVGTIGYSSTDKGGWSRLKPDSLNWKRFGIPLNSADFADSVNFTDFVSMTEGLVDKFANVRSKETQS